VQFFADLCCPQRSFVVLCLAPLRSFSALCRPLLSPAVLCGVCYGPLRSFVVLCGVCYGPLRSFAVFSQTGTVQLFPVHFPGPYKPHIGCTGHTSRCMNHALAILAAPPVSCMDHLVTGLLLHIFTLAVAMNTGRRTCSPLATNTGRQCLLI